MSTCCRVFLLVAFAFAFASVRFERASFAQERATPAARERVLVLRTAGWESPDSLREALAKELGATLVDPERASQATGELDVRFDAATKKLAVSFRDFGEPLAREISVAAGEVEARRAAVLLGGNLARGNVLRAAGVAREEPTLATERESARGPDDDTRRLQLLDAMLAVGSGAKERWRVVGVASAVFGAALLTSSFALGHYDDARTIVGGVGGGLLAVGVAASIPIGGEPASDALEALRRMRAAGGIDAVARIETMLDERADRARSQRKVWSSILLGAGVVATGAGVALSFSDIAPERREARGVTAALLVGGAAYSLLSVYRFVTPSEVEDVRDVYMRTRAAPPPTTAAFRPMVAPTRDGAVLGVTGTF